MTDKIKRQLNRIAFYISLPIIFLLCLIVVPLAALALANEHRKGNPEYEYSRW
jgi:hypothetical protein